MTKMRNFDFENGSTENTINTVAERILKNPKTVRDFCT
jgi:hypothetical protein